MKMAHRTSGRKGFDKEKPKPDVVESKQESLDKVTVTDVNNAKEEELKQMLLDAKQKELKE